MKRLVASAACLSAWLILLFLGYALAGAVHVLLAVALALFPWKSLSASS